MRRKFTVYASSNSDNNYWAKAKSDDPAVREKVAWDESIPEDVYLYMAKNETNEKVRDGLHENEMIFNASPEFWKQLVATGKPDMMHLIVWAGAEVGVDPSIIIEAIHKAHTVLYDKTGWCIGDLAAQVVAYFKNGELVYSGIEDEAPEEISCINIIYGLDDTGHGPEKYSYNDSTCSYCGKDAEGNNYEAFFIAVD